MMFARARLAWLFLPLVAAPAALLAPACSTSVETSAGGGGTGGATGTGGASSCPANAPDEGAACAGAVNCTYPVNCCGDTVASCTAGHWHVQPGGCVQKTPQMPCPDVQPQNGDACTPSCLPMECAYGDCGDGTPSVFATCEGGAWSILFGCPQDAGAGGDIPQGGACGQDADGGACVAGLACCYPCGIPGCTFTCTVPCDPADPECSNGCLMLF
jgi:hypothetical protein